MAIHAEIAANFSGGGDAVEVIAKITDYTALPIKSAISETLWAGVRLCGQGGLFGQGQLPDLKTGQTIAPLPPYVMR